MEVSSSDWVMREKERRKITAPVKHIYPKRAQDQFFFVPSCFSGKDITQNNNTHQPVPSYFLILILDLKKLSSFLQSLDTKM